MLIVTPTPGFESQEGRYVSVFRELQTAISEQVPRAEFTEVTFEFEFRDSIKDAEAIVLYYHMSWVTKPSHMGTLDGLDLLEMARNSNLPLLILIPSMCSEAAIVQPKDGPAEKEQCLAISKDSLMELGSTLLHLTGQ